MLQDIIRYGVERGEFYTSMKPSQAADFCLIAARGLVYNWCTLDGEYDLVRVMRDYMNELLKVFLIKP